MIKPIVGQVFNEKPPNMAEDGRDDVPGKMFWMSSKWPSQIYRLLQLLQVKNLEISIRNTKKRKKMLQPKYH